MRKLWLFLGLWLPFFLWSDSSFRIVCVHIGESLPPYVEIALAQARLFNPDCPIILIANAKALEGFLPRSNITFVSCESLPCTLEHEKFRLQTRRSDLFQEGYLSYTKERFLYLHDYMAAFGCENVFHIENDVLVYADLEKLLPLFQTCYRGIAAPFESERKCIPGFVYLSNPEVMQKLAYFFAVKASTSMTDMQIMALFWKTHFDDIDCLPMMLKSYFVKNSKEKMRYCKYVETFGSIFDGAAIGVFLDGIDASKGDFPPGYLMKKLFNPSHIDYKWEEDEKGRNVPYALYRSEKVRINNLHIASKRLERFTSIKWPW